MVDLQTLALSWLGWQMFKPVAYAPTAAPAAPAPAPALVSAPAKTTYIEDIEKSFMGDTVEPTIEEKGFDIQDILGYIDAGEDVISHVSGPVDDFFDFITGEDEGLFEFDTGFDSDDFESALWEEEISSAWDEPTSSEEDLGISEEDIFGEFGSVYEEEDILAGFSAY